MAKPSRQQRRDRRAQQPALAGAGVPPRVPTPPAARGGDEPERRPRRDVDSGGGFWLTRFIAESYAELKKVEWPSQKAVISGTVVVLVACAIVGAYLYLNDQVWSYVVEKVLLR